MTIGERLRKFGQERYGSIKAFAKAMGMSAPSLQQYLSDRREPGTPVLQRLIKLGCNVEWLMTGRIRQEGELQRISEPNVPYEAKSGGKGAPFVGRIRISRDGAESLDSKGVRPGAIVPFFVDRCFSLEVAGDILVNAEPIAVYPGNICVFEEGKEPKLGDIVAARLKDGRLLVRVVTKMSKRTVGLGAANKYRDYPALKIRKSDILQIGTLIGKLEMSEEVKKRFGLKDV